MNLPPADVVPPRPPRPVRGLLPRFSPKLFPAAVCPNNELRPPPRAALPPKPSIEKSLEVC